LDTYPQQHYKAHKFKKEKKFHLSQILGVVFFQHYLSEKSETLQKHYLWPCAQHYRGDFKYLE
jgi:hypothetical protein